jgi:hypothetical protein
MKLIAIISAALVATAFNTIGAWAGTSPDAVGRVVSRNVAATPTDGLDPAIASAILNRRQASFEGVDGLDPAMAAAILNRRQASFEGVGGLDPAMAAAILNRRQTSFEGADGLDPAIASAILNRRQTSFEGPDILDPAMAAAILNRQSAPNLPDRGSAETLSAGLQTQQSGSGLDWGDFAIGASSMLGLIVFIGVLGVAIHAVRSRRAHPSPA